jgi:hypothetical protein
LLVNTRRFSKSLMPLQNGAALGTWSELVVLAKTHRPVWTEAVCPVRCKTVHLAYMRLTLYRTLTFLDYLETVLNAHNVSFWM